MYHNPFIYYNLRLLYFYMNFKTQSDPGVNDTLSLLEKVQDHCNYLSLHELHVSSFFVTVKV